MKRSLSKIGKKAIILDCASSLQSLGHRLPDYDVAILWGEKEAAGEICQYFDNVQIVYVPVLLEVHRHVVHDIYLRWIHRASIFDSGLISNIERFRVNAFPSLWWGSLIFEKCNFHKSPHIHSVLKIIALRQWMNENSLASIEVRADSFSIPLQFCLQSLCRLAGINYSASFGSACRLALGLTLLKISIPARKKINYILGLRWLFRAYLSAVLCQLGSKNKRSSKLNLNHKITFLSYTSQSDKSIISPKGLSSSAYWGSLPGVLREKGLGVNWIYLFAPDRDLPSLEKAFKFYKRLDASSPESQAHLVLDSLFDFSLFCKCIYGLSLLAIRTYSRGPWNVLPPCQGLNIGVLYHHEYSSSSLGVTAARNLFYAALFEKLFSDIHVQSKVVYLQENMDWEYSMVETARKYQAAKIIGFPHSTISYWDLRYSYPRADLPAEVDFKIPIPDSIAMSGNLAKESFLAKNSWLASKLVDVEALRFGNLRPMSGYPAKKKNLPTSLSMLLLGVYASHEMESLMLFLGDALRSIKLTYDVKLAIKFHPLCDMSEDANRIFRSDFHLVHGDIHSLHHEFDVVLCGATSSACVDVAVLGCCPYVYHDPSIPIINPLYGTGLVTFVSSPDEFSSAVLSIESWSPDPLLLPKNDDLFNVDSCLKLWIDLISE